MKKTVLVDRKSEVYIAKDLNIKFLTLNNLNRNKIMYVNCGNDFLDLKH